MLVIRRRIAAVLISASAAAGLMVAGGTAVASASATPCAANHGAPGGYPAYPDAISQQNDPDFGLEQGATTTGYNNATDCGNDVPSQSAVYGS